MCIYFSDLIARNIPLQAYYAAHNMDSLYFLHNCTSDTKEVNLEKLHSKFACHFKIFIITKYAKFNQNTNFCYRGFFISVVLFSNLQIIN